jgi:hypothetical protein
VNKRSVTIYRGYRESRSIVRVGIQGLRRIKVKGLKGIGFPQRSISTSITS